MTIGPCDALFLGPHPDDVEIAACEELGEEREHRRPGGRLEPPDCRRESRGGARADPEVRRFLRDWRRSGVV